MLGSFLLYIEPAAAYQRHRKGRDRLSWNEGCDVCHNLAPFRFLMFSPSGSMFPLRPAVRGKKLFTDGNRLIFQWRGKRVVPPIQKTERRNDANDLHDLFLIPVLAQVGKHFVGHGIRHGSSASSRLRDLNRSTTNKPSACRIANIAFNDAMILAYDANPGRMEFSERTAMWPCLRRGCAAYSAQPLSSFGLNSRPARVQLSRWWMSALGHKRTYALQKPMSALPLIATAKADSRKQSCLLYPKADMCGALGHVCYGPKADIAAYSITSLALARSD